jgi:recombination protein RecA
MSLKELKTKINKEQGKDTATIGNEYRLKTPVICSTGSKAVDLVLGCGGLPEGRILEYYGPPSGGKTTLAIISMVEAQKKGGNVAFLDVENTFDRLWFENLGGDPEKLILAKPKSGSDTFEIIETLVASKEIDFIVVDSVSAMATSAEIDADYDDAVMAQLARLMSFGLKKINSLMLNIRSKCSVLFINQTRSGIGPFAPPEVRGGGKSLDFYASIIIAVRRKEVIGLKDDPEGFITKIEVKKNKCGRPFRVVETNLYIGKEGKFGIDTDEEIVDIAMSQDIIQRCKKDKDEDGGDIYVKDDKGKSYKFGDVIIAGKKKFIEKMLEDINLFNHVKKDVEQFFIDQDIPEKGSYNDMINKEISEQDKKEEKEKEKK